MVAALVGSEQQKSAAEQAIFEDRRRQFVEAGIKMNPWPTPVALEGGDRPPNYISDDKRNPRAYSIKRFQWDYKNWNETGPARAVPASTKIRPYRSMPAPSSEPENPTDVSGAPVLKPVSELFADAVDYLKY